ncbi:hypothetical protein ACJ72_02955 [Emergomyces africanus]|uniref:Uncharacterized protein n=1 Tax=Emergomyces africanus TaxID=1955775 RepID=A0A1B7P0Z6_9EURO|nr:hypothetical protein ACJ72_02955 [Emergomyces africanus]
MIRIRPTPLVPSDDEILSCVQKILVARILERGGTDPFVSPLGRRQPSSEAASPDSPYLGPNSGGVEGFTNCDPDDYDRSPALSNSKHKRETPPTKPISEQSPIYPAPQETPPSNADAQLVEQFDTITLNFTMSLSLSTWLGPFALSSRSITRHTYQGWGCDILPELYCHRKPLATPIPKGLSPLQYPELYLDTPPCSAELNKAPSALRYTIPRPISPKSTRCSCPYYQPTPPALQLSDSRDTDSESENDFILSDPGNYPKFRDANSKIERYLHHFSQSPTTSNGVRCRDNNQSVYRSLNVKPLQHQWYCLSDAPSTSDSSSFSCYGLDSASLKATPFEMHPTTKANSLSQAARQTASSQPSQVRAANPNQTSATPASSVQSVGTLATAMNLTQLFPLTSSYPNIPTGQSWLVAPPDIIGYQVPQDSRIPPETLGLPANLSQSDTYCTLPGRALQSLMPTYPVPISEDQPQGANLLRHTGTNNYHVLLSNIVGYPVPPNLGYV